MYILNDLKKSYDFIQETKKKIDVSKERND